MRETVQRRVVRETFENAGRPLRPEEVLERARELRPRIGLATVYRTIRSLLKSNEICAVELPGQPTHYEVERGHHHHHFHCRKCEQIFEVEQCPMQLHNFEIPGFQVESHQVTLYGLCKTCKHRKF